MNERPPAQFRCPDCGCREYTESGACYDCQVEAEDARTMSDAEPCRLGYEEHDGARYCFAHAGFVSAGTRRLICDRKHPPPASENNRLRASAADLSTGASENS